MIELKTIISYLPILLIPFLITIKILLGKSFSNNIFYPILTILIALSAITIGIVFLIVQPSYSPAITVTLMQKINTVFGGFLTIYFPLFNILLLFFYPSIFILSIILCKKSQSKTILKRLGISTIFLGILWIFSIPTIICPDFIHNYKKPIPPLEDIKKEITKSKVATKFALLQPLRAYYNDLTALNISLYISKKCDTEKLPTYSSPEITKLINEYIKYKEKSAKWLCYQEYIILSAFCTKVGYFDEAEKYSKLAAEQGVYTKSLDVTINIAKGEYEKALELANKQPTFWGDKRKLTAIYIGLKEYKKAQDVLNQQKDNFDNYWKPKAEIYLNYQKDDLNKANKLFEEYKKDSNKFNSYNLYNTTIELITKLP